MTVRERRRTSARRDSLLGDQPGAFASARFVRITPMKARRVVDMVRGLPVDDALALLQFAPQAASETVYKVLESAVATLGQGWRTHRRSSRSSELVFKEVVSRDDPFLGEPARHRLVVSVERSRSR